jgi:hypothetical protein
VAAVFGLYAVSLLFRWRSLSLPLVLLALDYWPLGRLRARRGDPFDRERVGVWAEKVPFLMLAIAAASLTQLAKSREMYEPSFAPVAAARALWLYPWALAWPGDYLAAYGLQGGTSPVLPAWAALVLTAAAAAALWLLRRRRPAFLLAGVFYAAAVLPPALGAQGGLVYVYLAYGYLGCIAFFALAGAAVRRGWGLAAVCVLALALIAGSRREARHWRDQISFWSRAAALDPDFAPAHGQLSEALLAAGRKEEAARHAARAAFLRSRTR